MNKTIGKIAFNRLSSLRFVPTAKTVLPDIYEEVPCDRERLSSLTDSISKNGILQPVSVVKANGCFAVISGRYRLKAVQSLGVSHLPCMVLGIPFERAILLTAAEVLSREGGNFLEAALILGNIISFLGTDSQGLAEMLGISHTALKSRLSLTALTPIQADRISACRLSLRHASAVAGAGQYADRLLDAVISDGLSSLQAEKLINEWQNPEISTSEKPKKTECPLIGDERIVKNTLDRTDKLIRRCGLNSNLSKTVEDGNTVYRMKVTIHR